MMRFVRNPYPLVISDQLYREVLDKTKTYRRMVKQIASSQSHQVVAKVVVAGAFSSGKSSFINHILGKSVAIEGANPTTRTTTEYVYGPKVQYYRVHGNRKKAITRAEYLRGSCKSGSNAQFCVAVPCSFLKKNNISLTDTPGFDDEKNDNDLAKKSIQEGDVLFWIVNVNDGTLRESELQFLLKATTRNDGVVPISFFLSQIDTMSPPKGGSVIDSLSSVREKIIAEGKGLRFKCAPIYYTSKPMNVAIRSVVPLVEKQKKELESVIADCRDALIIKMKHAVANTRKRAEKIRMELIAASRDRLIDLKKIVEKSEIQRSNRVRILKKHLRDAICSIVEKEIEDISSEISRSADCIHTYCSKVCPLWDEYTAEFVPSKFPLDTKSLGAKVASVLRHLTDFNGSSISVGSSKLAILKKLDEVIWSVTNDDYSSEARSRAANEMVDLIRCNISVYKDELTMQFYDNLSLPNFHFTNDNLRLLDETISQAKMACAWLDKILDKLDLREV